MIKKWLLKFNRRQGGFTIIELLVGIVVVSLISVAAMLTLGIMLKVSAGSGQRVTAIRQVQNAGMEITQDIQSAQTVIVGGAHFLETKWTDWEAVQYDVIYDIVNGQLMRSYSLDGADPVVTVVAKYIDTSTHGSPPLSMTRISKSGSSYTLTVTATITGFTDNGEPVSETRVYSILQRA